MGYLIFLGLFPECPLTAVKGLRRTDQTGATKEQEDRAVSEEVQGGNQRGRGKGDGKDRGGEETNVRVTSAVTLFSQSLTAFRATEQKSFEGEVFKLIQDALALPEPKKSGIDRPVSKHVSYTDVKLHPVYKEAKVYRRAANTVLHQIDKLINLESSESMGASDAGGKITASIQSAKRAIIGGRTMTKKDVDKLMADKFNEVSNGSQMTDQEKEEAKGLLAMGQEKTVEGVESGNSKANTIGWDERAQMMQSAIADMEWAAGDAT